MAFLPGNFRCNRAHTLAGHIFKEIPPPSTATICQPVSYKAAFGKQLSAKLEGVYSETTEWTCTDPQWQTALCPSCCTFCHGIHFTCHVSAEKEQGWCLTGKQHFRSKRYPHELPWTLKNRIKTLSCRWSQHCLYSTCIRTHLFENSEWQEVIWQHLGMTT